MSPKLSAKQMIREGLEEATEERIAADKALWELSGCHCCCCTGECTLTFQESTEEEQAAWLANYWANVEAQWERETYKF
jgi:hypothetical protein